MQNKKEILTICILTFNRSNYLSKILTDFNKIKDKKHIKVLIHDNNSSDQTKKIVKKFKDKLLNKLTYYNTNKFQGFKSNYLNCFKLARTKFIWVIGDDERINYKNIYFLVKFLQKKDKSIGGILLNSNYFNKDTSINYKREKLSQNARKFEITRDFNNIGNISSLIFNLSQIKKKKFISKCSREIKEKKLLNYGDYPHIYLFRYLYNLNKFEWYKLLSSIVFLRKGNARENDGTTIDPATSRYLIRRLNNDLNDYINNLIRIKKLNKEQINKTINLIFNKNFRSWIIQNKIFFSEILINNKLRNKLISNLSLINKTQFFIYQRINSNFLRILINIKNRLK